MEVETSIVNNLKTRHELNIGRKVFHVLNGAFLYAPYLFFGDEFPHTFWFLGIFLYLLTMELVRVKIPSVNNFVLKRFGGVFRQSEVHTISPGVPFAAALLFCTYFLPRPLSHVAVACASLADPFASFIGISYGKKKLLDSCTLEGTLACFGMGTFLCFIILFQYYPGQFLNLIILSLLSGVVTAAAELIPIPYVDDNFRVGVFTGSFLYLAVVVLGFL